MSSAPANPRPTMELPEGGALAVCSWLQLDAYWEADDGRPLG